METGTNAVVAQEAAALEASKAVEVQAARRYLYALGQSLFGGEPTEATLAAVDIDLLGQALDILGIAGDEGFSRALTAVRADVEGLSALASQYTRLFIGPITPAATPWESTYRSKSKALFRQETLEVRNAYRAQGFLPGAYPRVPDDHIALELAFLSLLARWAVDALEAGDSQDAARFSQVSRAFLDEHLLLWIDDYASDLEAAAPGSLYGALARLTTALAHRDRELLA